MRKAKNSLRIVLLSVVLFTSCTSENDTESIAAENIDKITVQYFLSIGELHNDFLTNVKENFNELNSPTSKQETIDYINDFNKSYIGKLDISTDEKEFLSNEFDKTKAFVVEDNLIENSFGNSIFNKTKANQNKEEISIFTLISDLKNQNEINENSQIILLDLAHSLKDNYQGKLSNDLLRFKVEKLIVDFNSFGYENNGEGAMVATILAISISSLDWWDQNPDALGVYSPRNESQKSQLIAPWLAADLIGGLVSGVTAAAGQAIINGEVDLGTVGWSALAGAVSASTGIVGKIVQAIT